ncbi:MAG: hypothetical protein CME62_07540 [Halobacteriovoraceae bacterium]|nr:hypothetical protein [Halobacteriovoraceae bacterium]|tara:strand:- start:6133 stop:6984 length:852 start_codon:yes stop_codon:yes gene_type:complete
MKLTKKFLTSTMDIVQDIAYEAGEILLSYQKERHNLNVHSKGAEGIASEADISSEEYIIQELRSRFPKHDILSEENVEGVERKALYKKAQNADFCWVIDPLDGTNNFVNGLPIYAVSIALMAKGEVVVGVVYNPFSGECFFGAKDQGSYLIDFRINPLKKYTLKNNKNTKSMDECIFSPAPVFTEGSRFEVQLSSFKKNITGARAVRRLGSAALELCYVANKNFDGYWEQYLKPWDVAAAFLILQEAGVKVTDFDGRKFSPFKNSVIAAADPLHKKILGKISH